MGNGNIKATKLWIFLKFKFTTRTYRSNVTIFKLFIYVKTILKNYLYKFVAFFNLRLSLK